MAERSKAHAWKACVGKLTVGSNPTLSAKVLILRMIDRRSRISPSPKNYEIENYSKN